jgi:hypothetical protein
VEEEGKEAEEAYPKTQAIICMRDGVQPFVVMKRVAQCTVYGGSLTSNKARRFSVSGRQKIFDSQC